MKLPKWKNVLKGDTVLKDTKTDVVEKDYKKKQLTIIAVMVILVVITLFGVYGNNPTSSEIMTMPLSYYLQQNYEERRLLKLTLDTDIVIWVSVAAVILSLTFYLMYLEIRHRKVVGQCPYPDCRLRKFMVSVYRSVFIFGALLIFILFNLIFYREDIKNCIASEKPTTHVVTQEKIKHKGPDLKNPAAPPFLFNPHATVETMSKEAGMTIERLQLYSLMWTLYKFDEPLRSKFPDDKKRFYELEKYHFHLVCKDNLSCINYLNKVAPINRSLVTLKVALFKDADTLGVASEYFSKNIEKLNKEPLLRMRDAVQTWAKETERNGTGEEIVEVPKILYMMNIEPTKENLDLFDWYIKTIDETPLNPKISVGFLSSAIDADPNLKIPIPRSQSKLNIIKATY